MVVFRVTGENRAPESEVSLQGTKSTLLDTGFPWEPTLNVLVACCGPLSEPQ